MRFAGVGPDHIAGNRAFVAVTLLGLLPCVRQNVERARQTEKAPRQGGREVELSMPGAISVMPVDHQSHTFFIDVFGHIALPSLRA